MKESDAKQKWCPMARVGSEGNAGFNRDLQGGENGCDYSLYKCIGSDCACWVDDFKPSLTEPDDTPLGLEPIGHCGLINR